MTLAFSLPGENVSNGTSIPQDQLCQIILKFVHKCRSYGLDKSGQMHTICIHRTKVVATMSRSLQTGLAKTGTGYKMAMSEKTK